ncbi:MAG: VanZ family protein [Candidatus Methanoperedens sp.]
MEKKSLKNMNIQFKVFLIVSVLYSMLIFYLSSGSSFGDAGLSSGFLDIEFIRNIFHYLSSSDLNFLLSPFYIFYKQPDKLVHLILYAGFGILLYYTLKNSPNSTSRNHALLFAIIIGTVYGASDEFHQSFVPGRTASFWDLAADSTGVIMAQAVIFIKDKLCIRNRNFSISTK